MNTRLQGALLQELYGLLPEPSQLWVATHSIGMMRRARELATKSPDSVIFLDFGGHDFDQTVKITPASPTRTFWENILNVALDDLANLVASREVVICEGNPSGVVASRNAEHDAAVYNMIFSDEFPDVKFLAGGNAKDVTADRLEFVAALPNVVAGIFIRRLIDRDDHAPSDVASMARKGIAVLSRRHLEAYVYDDEVLVALCSAVGRPDEAEALFKEKQQAITSSVRRGNPTDDIKSSAGEIYNRARSRLALTACGNGQMAFARSTLAPLMRAHVLVYRELRKNVFGK